MESAALRPAGRVLLLLLAPLIAAAASVPPETAPPLDALNARLLAGASATRTLEDWCREHRLAADPHILAERVAGPDKPIAPVQRARLGIGAEEAVRYRHVRLRCGTRVLSEADNWYVPSRLTPAMNAALDGSDVPFGTVVAPLGISRRTFSVERPARSNGEAASPWLLRHRAIVRDRAGRPIAEVAESYRPGLFDDAAAR